MPFIVLLKVINSISSNNEGFPYERSTEFTPEWPVAALAHVPEEVLPMIHPIEKH